MQLLQLGLFRLFKRSLHLFYFPIRLKLLFDLVEAWFVEVHVPCVSLFEQKILPDIDNNRLSSFKVILVSFSLN